MRETSLNYGLSLNYGGHPCPTGRTPVSDRVGHRRPTGRTPVSYKPTYRSQSIEPEPPPTVSSWVLGLSKRSQVETEASAVKEEACN